MPPPQKFQKVLGELVCPPQKNPQKPVSVPPKSSVNSEEQKILLTNSKKKERTCSENLRRTKNGEEPLFSLL